jgi:hypothetical protein
MATLVTYPGGKLATKEIGSPQQAGFDLQADPVTHDCHNPATVVFVFIKSADGQTFTFTLYKCPACNTMVILQK